MPGPTSLLFQSVPILTSLRIGLRELRKPGIGIVILFATLVFATTILVLSVSLTQSVRDELRQSAQQTIGADISLRLFHRAPTPEELSFLETLGTISLTIEQRVMVQPSDNRQPVLSELKAVDTTYPLFGRLTLFPDIALGKALGTRNGIPGIVVAQDFLEQNGHKIGDIVYLGDQPYQIRARITAEPERKFRLFSLGPRIIVGLENYRDNSLLAPGKQVYWYVRLKLSGHDALDTDRVVATIEEHFPGSGWRIVNAADGVPGLERIGEFASAFVSLIGIAIFAIATSAIHNALTADLVARRRQFAALRSLGARPSDITSSITWQMAIITSTAMLVAVILTFITGKMIAPLCAQTLGFTVEPDFGDVPIIACFVFGFVGLVAIDPIRNASFSSPAYLFRHQNSHETGNTTSPRSVKLSIAKLVLVFGLLGIAGALIDLGWFSIVLLAVLGLSQGFFIILGQLIRVLADRLAGRHSFAPSLRLALRNIARPASPTVTITASFGLATACLGAVVLFGALADQHLKSVLPSQTPDVVFFDIPPSTKDAFLSDMRNIKAVQDVNHMPFLHGRVTHVNGDPLTQENVPRRYHWFLRGDRGMSWTDHPTSDMADNPVTDGQWWNGDSINENLASLDAGVAKAINAGIGDSLTINIMGQSHIVRIANLRQIDWTRLGLDFPIVLSPMAPAFDHGVISAVSLKDATDAKTTLAPLARAFPDIPVIFVDSVLAKLTRLFDRVIAGLTGLTSLATIGAVLVVICGLIALRQQQADSLVMLRALGIRPVQITSTGALETGLMVTCSGLTGLAVGTTIAVIAAQAIGSITLPQIAQVAGPLFAATFTGIVVLGFGGGWLLQAASLRRQPGWRG